MLQAFTFSSGTFSYLPVGLFPFNTTFFLWTTYRMDHCILLLTSDPPPPNTLALMLSLLEYIVDVSWSRLQPEGSLYIVWFSFRFSLFFLH